MKWKSVWRNVRAISPLIATLLLIAITLVGGLIVYGFMAGMMGRTGTAVSVQIVGMNLVKAGDQALLTVTIKNTGSKHFDGIVVTGYDDNGKPFKSRSPGNEETNS